MPTTATDIPARPRQTAAAHRFKKGRSGNPGGRSDKTLRHCSAALDETVSVTTNDGAASSQARGIVTPDGRHIGERRFARRPRWLIDRMRGGQKKAGAAAPTPEPRRRPERTRRWCMPLVARLYAGRYCGIGVDVGRPAWIVSPADPATPPPPCRRNAGWGPESPLARRWAAREVVRRSAPKAAPRRAATPRPCRALFPRIQIPRAPIRPPADPRHIASACAAIAQSYAAGLGAASGINQTDHMGNIFRLRAALYSQRAILPWR